jgi:glycosyltransferase involved in cell wall biosynthesis
MKIGIYDPYLDDIGGGERYMMTIAKCLSTDNEVDVFWDELEDFEMIRDRFSLDLSKVRLTKNIFNLSFIDKQLASRKYDAIIILSDGSIPILSAKKVFLHLQQPVSYSLSVKDKIKLKKIDKIFCNSKFTKNFVEDNYKIKCELLYPPVSIFGNNSKKENTIFHVGRFRVMNVKTQDYKKQQVMIDTFKSLVDGGLKNWKFLLAVSLPDENDETFIKMKNTTKNYPIEFLVNSDNKKLWKEGSKAKIYWHATGYGEDLKANPHYAEHFGISTVEAMGAGLVPVVINAGGQKEIVENGKNGFLWDSLEEFREKTLSLIDDQKLLSKLSLAAFQRAGDFDENNFCHNINKIINA